MTALQATRENIHASIAADIRECSAAQTRITLNVALKNYEYFFNQGRYTEAKAWWRIVHEYIAWVR